MPGPDEILPGRDVEMPVADRHSVHGTPLRASFEGMELALFGMGCFWGAEKLFWQAPGVYSTSVGYAGGTTPNPLYEEVCGGRTGHTEVVRVVFDPNKTDFTEMLVLFWEGHDPTQGMGQGNDRGTQYRSALYTHSPEQQRLAEVSREAFQQLLAGAGRGEITSEIGEAPTFYYAEDYHQQYLAKNPAGYCGLGGTGMSLGRGDWAKPNG